MRFARKTPNPTSFLGKLLLLVCFGIGILLMICANNNAINFSSIPIPPEMQLWSGEALRNHHYPKDHIQTIEIAVAYCDADLQWLMNSIAHELPKQSTVKITFLSKCENDMQIPEFTSIPNVKKVEILTLPNKGGCDLAFAHFINQYMARENARTAATTVIFFLKDTPRLSKNCHQRGRYRSFHEMLHISSSYGEFVCGVKLKCDWSAFHDTRILKSFAKNSYKRHGDSSQSNKDFNSADYKDIENFIDREFEWSFPNNEVTEVCYGGTFAVPAARLFADEKLRGVFSRLESILLKGPSMSVVEHFAERLWASWLANPLDRNETETIYTLRRSIRTEQGRYMGTLITDDDTARQCGL